MGAVIDERSAKRQENQIDHHKEETGGDDVFLRIAKGLACQVFLHHVLVQTRHGDSDESARNNLLPIVFRMVEIRLEDARIALVGAGRKQFGNTDIEIFEDYHNGCNRRQQKECGL